MCWCIKSILPLQISVASVYPCWVPCSQIRHSQSCFRLFWHSCQSVTCADSDLRTASTKTQWILKDKLYSDTHRIKGTLRSFMACRTAHSPCSSHHLLARDWNLLTSSGSTVVWEDDWVLHTQTGSYTHYPPLTYGKNTNKWKVEGKF